jgi:hypothetical protein
LPSKSIADDAHARGSVMHRGQALMQRLSV